jgi:predicted Zn-dependent protease with MMP-like domain
VRALRRERRVRLPPPKQPPCSREGWRDRGAPPLDSEPCPKGARLATVMTRARFEQLVAEAIRTIPARFRDELRNLAVIVEDEPSDDLLDEMEIEPPDTLFGLYQGTPLTERAWDYGNTLPDRIVLYQGPIEDASEDDEVIVTIGETLIHEVGHYFGLSEEELEEIEERYWRGRDRSPEEDL